MAPKLEALLKDKKFEKGRKAAAEQAEGWKGPNHKERQAEKEESKRKIQKAKHEKVEKASWKKQATGMFFILFMCGMGLFTFLSSVMGFIAGNGVVTLDEKDTEALKRVLFGGEPWLVYCVNNDTVNQRLPKVIEDSAHTLASSLSLKVGVLKCWDATESGRSVAQRFKLKLNPPLTFLVANANKPRMVDLVGVSRPEDLEKKLKPGLKVDTHKISTLKSWANMCTSRRTCVVVGHKWPAQKDAALTVLRPLLEYHRAVKVVTLDTSFWQLKLDEPVTATKDKGQKGAAVLCLARKEGKFPANETHMGRFLGSLDASSAGSFLTACAKQEDLVPIGVAPKIKTRPPKPPKVVTPEPYKPSASPASRPPPPKKPARANVDRVGSRSKMEDEDEALFEAVDEDESDEAEEDSEPSPSADEEADEDDGNEVEL